jgi:hypothetical protein
MGDVKMLGWHFLRPSLQLNYGDGRVVVAGQKLEAAVKDIEMCSYGMHASPTIRDAIRCKPDGECTVLTRIALHAPVIRGSDKSVARGRTALWILPESETRNVLLEYACRAFEVACGFVAPLGIEPDQRSIDAVDGVRLYMQGRIDRAALVILRRDAWDARYDQSRKYAAAYAAHAAAAYAAACAADAAYDAAAAYAAAAAYDAADAAYDADADAADARSSAYDVMEAIGLQIATDAAKRLGVWVPDPIVGEE